MNANQDRRERKLARAREATTELVARDFVDSAWLSGSLLAGLGTDTSDVDVFVMLAEGVPVEEEMRQIFGGGERVDVEFYEAAAVEAAVDAVLDFELTHHSMAPVWLPEKDLDLVIRMSCAETLRDSPRWAELRRRLDDGAAVVRQRMLARWAVEANNFLEDFEGARLDGDLEATALVGQSLMLVAGKAVAAAAGDVYLGRKWVYHQLRRSAGSAFPLDEFARYQLGRWGEEGLDEGCAKFTGLLQTCLIAAQTLGWHAPTDLDRWPHWTRESNGPVRRPAYNAIRLSEGVELNWELHRQVVVKPDVALVWGLCNGQSEDAVIEAAVALADAAPDLAGLDGQRARGVLDSLRKHDLVGDA